jgi:Holliday junction resolvasome RuvABC endonuclease subunit
MEYIFLYSSPLSKIKQLKGIIMKVLGLDSATKKTGWCFNEDGKIISYGLIKADDKEKNTDIRIEQIYKQIKEKVLEFKPDYIVFENTPSNNNPQLARSLSRLHGCIMSLGYDYDIGFRDYMPSEWRKLAGTYDGKREHMKREYQKQKAVEICNERYGTNFVYDKNDNKTEDDIAEAILISESFYKLK